MIGDAFANKIQINTLLTYTTSAKTAYGVGTAGLVLTSDGANTYWSTLGGAAGRGVTDKDTATVISNSDTNLITARAVYYGLPTINGAHNYTSSTNYYVPTTQGTSGQFFVSAGNNTPSWKTLNAHTYTPEGTINVAPTVTVNTTTVNSITAVGTLPSFTQGTFTQGSLPDLTMTVTNEVLSFTFNKGTLPSHATDTFTTGTLPTKGANTTVATGIKSATATGSFVGTAATLSHSVS